MQDDHALETTITRIPPMTPLSKAKTSAVASSSTGVAVGENEAVSGPVYGVRGAPYGTFVFGVLRPPNTMAPLVAKPNAPPARRARPSSDEAAERPKKKKKRKILNPEKAQARTQLPLDDLRRADQSPRLSGPKSTLATQAVRSHGAGSVGDKYANKQKETPPHTQHTQLPSQTRHDVTPRIHPLPRTGSK